MPPKKRGLHQEQEGAGEEGTSSGGGGPPVLKKRCRSFDLEIRGCRHLQEELAAKCVQSVQVRLDAAVDRAVARITEDVTKALTSFFSHVPSFCRTGVNQSRPPRYRLSFMNGLDSEVFTKKVICATNGEPIRICMLVNNQLGSEETELHHRVLSAKIKVVVLNGDFNKDIQESWTTEEFKDCIVQPRDNVGSVLTGVSNLRLKNGEAFLQGVAINDISKFVRCGKFRLGVMIDDNLGERVLEGITEPFIVKDRRGEGSKKHSIPLLTDDVWRLNKIAKDGAYHKALMGNNINYVQDFLTLYYKDEQALRNILFKAPKRVWTAIVENAKKCDPGNKLHSFVMQGHTTLFVNSVCQIVGATVGDNYTPFNNFDMHMKGLVGEWRKVAYEHIAHCRPDYELDNGKPRPLNQTALYEMSMLENKPADLVQGPSEQHICQTGDHQDTFNPNSGPCKFESLLSVRITPSDDDMSYDFSLYPICEQYCASTSENDITGSVTLHCANNTASEITGSVVLTKAPLTMEQQSCSIPQFTDNDASLPPLCEDNQPVRAHLGHSLSSSIRALLEAPIYSRHSSFKDTECHHAAAASAGPSL